MYVYYIPSEKFSAAWSKFYSVAGSTDAELRKRNSPLGLFRLFDCNKRFEAVVTSNKVPLPFSSGSSCLVARKTGNHNPITNTQFIGRLGGLFSNGDIRFFNALPPGRFFILGVQIHHKNRICMYT